MHTLDPTELAGVACNLDSAAVLIHKAIDRIDDVAMEALLRRVAQTVQESADDVNSVAEGLAPARSRLRPEDVRWIETAAGVLR